MFTKSDLRKLIIPLIIEQLLGISVGMFDTMMISSLGESAVSGVSLVDMLNVLMINIFAALATGGAVICAHEIGHDQLHRNMAKNDAIQEFMLYDMATKPEYEANIVAAEILLDTDTIIEYIYDYGFTSEQIARVMYSDINLVALKVADLVETGYDLRRIGHGSGFLK